MWNSNPNIPQISLYSHTQTHTDTDTDTHTHRERESKQALQGIVCASAR
jgi:hypothetical protein